MTHARRPQAVKLGGSSPLPLWVELVALGLMVPGCSRHEVAEGCRTVAPHGIGKACDAIEPRDLPMLAGAPPPVRVDPVPPVDVPPPPVAMGGGARAAIGPEPLPEPHHRASHRTPR